MVEIDSGTAQKWVGMRTEIVFQGFLTLTLAYTQRWIRETVRKKFYPGVLGKKFNLLKASPSNFVRRWRRRATKAEIVYTSKLIDFPRLSGETKALDRTVIPTDAIWMAV